MNITGLYHDIITSIGDGTGASDSLLHVHAGLAILFLARLITRRSLATPIPFLVVVAAEAANEIMDRLTYGSWRGQDTLFDIANTPVLAVRADGRAEVAAGARDDAAGGAASLTPGAPPQASRSGTATASTIKVLRGATASQGKTYHLLSTSRSISDPRYSAFARDRTLWTKTATRSPAGSSIFASIAARK